MSLFQDKVTAQATRLNSLHISSSNILLGYRVCWQPIIKHVDPTLHLSQQSKIIKQFRRILLPCIKVNRNFPCAVIPIALAFGGLGMKIMELENGLESISHLISFWDSATTASNLLRVSLEFLQLKAGTTCLVLNKPFSPHSQLSIPKWFSSVQDILDTYQLEITIPSLTIPNPSSDNYIKIIDLSVWLKTFSTQQIKQINAVRLALQACFISDLLRPRSNRIMDCYWQGSQDKHSKSSYN